MCIIADFGVVDDDSGGAAQLTKEGFVWAQTVSPTALRRRLSLGLVEYRGGDEVHDT